MANTHDTSGLTLQRASRVVISTTPVARVLAPSFDTQLLRNICGDMLSHIHLRNAPLSTSLGCTRFAKGLKATGEGWP